MSAPDVDENLAPIVCRGEVRADDVGGEARALEIFAQSLRAPLRLIDRKHMPARCSQLHGLAAGRCAQVKHLSAFASTQQAGWQRCGEILHPPVATVKAGQFFHAALRGEADMAGRE